MLIVVSVFPRIIRHSLATDNSVSLTGGTLQQVIDQRSQLGVLMWNDEIPAPYFDLARTNFSSGTSGHTKGVLVGDADGGFWLTHSMPLFPVLVCCQYTKPPPISASVFLVYFFLQNESHFRWTPSITYAQSFLCISLGSAVDVESAASQV